MTTPSTPTSTMKEAERLVSAFSLAATDYGGEASHGGVSGSASETFNAAEAALLAFIRSLVEAQPCAVAGEAVRAALDGLLRVAEELMAEPDRSLVQRPERRARFMGAVNTARDALVSDLVAAPSAALPLKWEVPTDEQVAKWAAHGAPDTRHLDCLEARRISRAFAICEPCNTGFPERCLYKSRVAGEGAAAPSCDLCERGFPLKNGDHYGTQSLGMIPTTRCAAAPVETEQPAFYAFKHNHGHGKFGWTFHTPEEYPGAYRDTCLEIVPLYAKESPHG